MRSVVVLVGVGLLVAACGGKSRPATTAAAPPAKKALKVAVTAETHHPKVGRTWTYEVHVTDAATGKPVPARIHLQMFFNGVSVGEVGLHKVRNGVWKETIPATGPNAFPPAAIGQPLTLRATVTATGYRKATGGWKLSVVK